MALKQKNGFQFVFTPEELQKLLDQKPKKIGISCYLVQEITKDGRKVGAMQVLAEALGVKKVKTKGLQGAEALGCPVPPCKWD